MQYINTEILITEMGVSNEAKNVIPLNFLRKIKHGKVRGNIMLFLAILVTTYL
jgi:hypothetical protein